VRLLILLTGMILLFGEIIFAANGPYSESAPEDAEFITGADVSILPQIEDHGGVYKQNGVSEDALKIFSDHGVNFIRLKLWHTPSENYNNLARLKAMALRIKEAGFKFLLNFHYSDTWADPGSQTVPAAWQGLSFDVLCDSVYQYTKMVMQILYEQGTLPDMVQIGNEINSGMLWNYGRVGGSFNAQWPNLAELLKEGIRGVRESCPEGDSVEVMIHIANAANNSGCRWFFDNINAQNVPYNIIGLSFYPWWHGTLTQTRGNLNDLAVRYHKKIIIVEYAYPWTLQWYDSQNNMVGSSDQLHDGYPASVSGQASFIRDLIQVVRQTAENRGAGVFYWEPEYISVPQVLSPWENCALFDFGGNALESMNVFMETPDSLNPVNVTVRLNTATNWDTLTTRHFVQMRGEVKGNSYITLPDGKQITWDANSDLILQNKGGDYWETSFLMYPGDVLSYKFWSGFSSSKGTFLRVGWEGPVYPSPESSQNIRLITAAEHDTLIALQYYNSGSDAQLQYWRPFEHREDSIAVYFRVNLDGVMKSGRFNPEVNGPVCVRGDAAASAGQLDWETSKLTLGQETGSVYNGSFWSGALHLPRSGYQAGHILKYKFFIENDSQNGWENNVPDRELMLTESLLKSGEDTTLHWVYFDNASVFNEIIEQDGLIPREGGLLQNYPNPFNNLTRIEFSLAIAGKIMISVYDMRGQKISRITDASYQVGRHTCDWDGRDEQGVAVSSGVYLLQLRSDHWSETRKMILIR